MTDTKVYEQMLADAGIPTTPDGMQAEWNRINAGNKVRIANDTTWSPFWRLISAIVTTPAVWLVTLLIHHALPNAFLRDAGGPWLELLAWAVDVEKKGAVKTRGHLRFIREAADGELALDAGRLIATPEINGQIYRVIIAGPVTIPDGTVSALVPVEAEKPGTAYNLGPGYFSVLPEPIDGIASVTNEPDWISVAGADEESDDALRSRARNQFSAVGQYHHDAAYRASIAEFAGIRTDYIWFEKGAPRGPGSANAYIMIDSGCPTQEFVDGINEHIAAKGHHGHGDDMLCMPMPPDPVVLEVTAFHAGILAADEKEALTSDVADRIRYAFRENQSHEKITRTMPYSRFSMSRLGDELHGQVPALLSIVFSRSDIVSGMALPTLDTLSVTLEVA